MEIDFYVTNLWQMNKIADNINCVFDFAIFILHYFSLAYRAQR